MYSHVNTASQPVGQQTQLDSGIRFTAKAMGKTLFTTVGAVFRGYFGGRADDGASGRVPSYRRSADGDGH